MRDPKKRAMSIFSHWARRCLENGASYDELLGILAVNRSAVNRVKNKEKGREKETFPPHPLLEKKGSEEKATTTTTARACGHACARTRVRGGEPKPTWEEVEAYATDAEISLTFARAWYDRMNTDNGGGKWVHPKSGYRIGNWCRYLYVCWKCRDEFNDDDPPPAKAAKVENQKLADFLKEYCA